VTDCLNYPRDCEKCGLVLLAIFDLITEVAVSEKYRLDSTFSPSFIGSRIRGIQYGNGQFLLRPNRNHLRLDSKGMCT